eukprot:Gb_20448 [translate_table: standard]
MLCPFKFRTLFTGHNFPLISTSYDSITSWIAAPISHKRTSMPASLIPVFVASLEASSSGSNMGLNATVKAQSTICPSTCVPKSSFMTSSY